MGIPFNHPFYARIFHMALCSNFPHGFMLEFPEQSPIWKFPKSWGYPCSSSILVGFSMIKHPASLGMQQKRSPDDHACRHKSSPFWKPWKSKSIYGNLHDYGNLHNILYIYIIWIIIYYIIITIVVIIVIIVIIVIVIINNSQNKHKPSYPSSSSSSSSS